MKYLHIMHNEKFIKAYIEFINENFDKSEHKFLIIDGVREKDIEILVGKNIEKYISKGRNFNGIIKKVFLILQLPILYFKLFIYCKKSEKIYFHGLFDQRIIVFLYLFKGFLNKSNWLIWGGDLYSYLKRKNKFLYRIYYRIDDYVKSNFYGYITPIEGDYELVQKWYKANGKYFDCFMYPSNLYKNIEIILEKKEEVYIQVGNSADPSNNHFEILNKLEKFKNQNIKLFCILSYGDKKYAEKVIVYGKKIFDEKFIPITEFMKYENYMFFLNELDIAIFAHDRQQAFGNITSLLSMNKTVYLKEIVTTYETLTKLGLKIKSFNRLETLEKFEKKILENNKKIIKKIFSKENLIKEWEKIFEEKLV